MVVRSRSVPLPFSFVILWGVGRVLHVSKVDKMKTIYYFYESNWGVTVAVTRHPHFSVITTLEMTDECLLHAQRHYFRCEDGVTVDDAGEVVDLELTSECPTWIECQQEVDVPVTMPSASAKRHKLGGLKFGDKAFITVRVPVVCDFVEGM